MGRVAIILILLAAVADAAPNAIEIRAQTQLSLTRVKRVDDGRVEVVGTLVDKLTGEALPNQRVIVKIGDEEIRVWTEADGSFHGYMAAADGETEVHLTYAGNDHLDHAQPLTITADPTKSQVALALARVDDDPAGVKLEAHATSDEGAAVVIGVDIAIARVGSDDFKKLRTLESNRTFVLSRKDAGGPGNYRVRATFAGDDARQTATSELTVELAAQTTTTIDVPKKNVAFEDTIVVTGTVIDDDHAPVKRAAVALMAADKRLAQGATADDGSYRFRVEAEILGKGDWAIQVQADPATAVLRPSRSPPATIRVAAPQPVPVSYTVAAFLATALAAGGFFAARTKPWRRLKRPAPPAEVPSEHGPVEQAHGGLVVAKPGVVATLRRAADDGFAGVVRDTVRGRPIAQAVVRLICTDQEREVRTAADGSFALEKLAPGEWQAEVAAVGHITEKFGVTAPHRGELRGVRIDLVPVRERVFQLYRRAAEPVLPEPRLWGVWSPRQIVDHVRARRPSPALAELTDFVEEIYFSPRVAAETVLAHASERVDRAISERARRA